MLKHYLEIVKPGIIIGNVISLSGSFLFASNHTNFDFFLFLCTLLGTSLVIASACVFNNLIDRDIDQKMKRTSDRVLSKKILSPVSVYTFSIILGLLGIFILTFFVNDLTMFLSCFGFCIYVIFYSLLCKRKTIHSTLIGSFSGSIPSVIGYTAVTNTIDLYSVLLFIIFVFWQMAHFYAISVFRIKDYKKAKIPIFSVVKGVEVTKKYIFYYIVLFIVFSSFLTFFGYLSYIFLLFSSIINFYWLLLSYFNMQKNNNKKNAMKLFYYSIIVVFLFNLLLSLDFLFL